jgi:streptogramin lyase
VWNLPATLALSAVVSIATLQPVATVKIGKTADWVAVTPDAVWVGSTTPNAVHHIDPLTNTEAATVAVPGKPCATATQTNTVLRQWRGPGGDSLAIGHGAIWLTDYHKGTLTRLRLEDALAHTQR